MVCAENIIPQLCKWKCVFVQILLSVMQSLVGICFDLAVFCVRLVTVHAGCEQRAFLDFGFCWLFFLRIICVPQFLCGIRLKI